ncbi:hypothetical protein [Vibrio sp. 10N.261.54.A5]|uniref:hypothetical protein n=1 Tax=Vibrio sp. 10N.261.54.A5 TaxID=3229686 RepID=UPI0035522B3A
MSMCLLIAGFNSTGGKLDANYTALSERVYVNEFLNDLVSSDFIEEFIVFDEEDEYTYREIDIDKLSDKLTEVSSSEDFLYSTIDGLKRAERLKSQALNLVLLNKIYQLSLAYYRASASKETTVKFIVA